MNLIPSPETSAIALSIGCIGIVRSDCRRSREARSPGEAGKLRPRVVGPAICRGRRSSCPRQSTKAPPILWYCLREVIAPRAGRSQPFFKVLAEEISRDRDLQMKIVMDVQDGEGSGECVWPYSAALGFAPTQVLTISVSSTRITHVPALVMVNQRGNR